jgi:hypothetical protein
MGRASYYEPPSMGLKALAWPKRLIESFATQALAAVVRNSPPHSHPISTTPLSMLSYRFAFLTFFILLRFFYEEKHLG